MSASVVEVRRVIGQVFREARFAPIAFFDTFWSTFYYDLFLRNRVVSIDGWAGWTEKVSIFLIYPESGLNVGHGEALRYMISEGYSPVVVSSFPLDDRDMQYLLPLCSRIIVRPNFGCDFGGYRDGMLSIKEYREKILHLALFDDSVWFPLPGGAGWLTSAERMRVDFAGALSHAGPDWRKAVEFAVGDEKAKRKYSELFHFCSFALLFSGNSLKSDAFWKFWGGRRISSSKRGAVMYGERVLSKFMFNAGFSHALSVTPQDIVYRLRQVSTDQKSAEVKLFEETGGWPAYSLAEFLWKEFKFMFLKKKDVGRSQQVYSEGLEATVHRLSRPIEFCDDSELRFGLVDNAGNRAGV